MCSADTLYLAGGTIEPTPYNWDVFVTEINQEDLSYIWEILSTNYAGFAEMQEKGFSRKKLMAIKDSKNFEKLFTRYIDECHFAIRIREYYFDKPTARDESTFASKDPDGLYFEKETDNAYYIRFTDCISDQYMKNFQSAGLNAEKKGFIILDDEEFRSHLPENIIIPINYN